MPVPPASPPLLAAFSGWAPAVLGLAGAWLAVSALYQWGAARAAALGRLPAPDCFGPREVAPERSAPLRLVFLGDLQRGVLDTVGPLAEVLRETGADLLVSSGDLVSHGEAPYYGIVLEAFGRAGIETPVRVVPGNHDLLPRRSKDDRIGGALFERHFGPRHWACRLGPVLLVGLDVGADWLLEPQLPWLERTLAEAAGTPWICVAHRPPWYFDAPERAPYGDLAPLLPVLEGRPPLLVVAGHLHDYRDETVNGVRYVVNAHGGDVHGLALKRGDFELLHVSVQADGSLRVEPRRYRRRLSWRAAWNQVCVRLWADRRRPLGALLALPVGLLLRLLGRGVPVVRHPVERRYPEREVLAARRAAPRAPDRGEVSP